MTPKSRSQYFPHLNEELIGGGCRSRSSHTNPSIICKNYGRNERESKLKKINNDGKKRAKEH
jgi:hypothetical protein